MTDHSQEECDGDHRAHGRMHAQDGTLEGRADRRGEQPDRDRAQYGRRAQAALHVTERCTDIARRI